MARPRTPSNILELRGSFKTHPERRRKDLEGVGAFDPQPPGHLPQELVPSWHEIVKQINPCVLTASDQSSVEIMARLMLQIRLTNDMECVREMRQWFGQYGLTAVGRAKLGTPKKDAGGSNPFA